MTSAQFFACQTHFQQVNSAATGLMMSALYTTGSGDNSIVYNFYTLAARWTVACKNRQLMDLTVLIKSLVSLTVCVMMSIIIISIDFNYFDFFFLNKDFPILFQANSYGTYIQNLQNVDTAITIH